MVKNLPANAGDISEPQPPSLDLVHGLEQSTFQPRFPSGHPRLNSSLLKLEKAVAPHSSTLAWRIPWMEEPGRLQSMFRRGKQGPLCLSTSETTAQAKLFFFPPHSKDQLLPTGQRNGATSWPDTSLGPIQVVDKEVTPPAGHEHSLQGLI